MVEICPDFVPTVFRKEMQQTDFPSVAPSLLHCSGNEN